MRSQLTQLDDQTLLEQTEALVRKERETITEVLHHLAEVERRKLFASRGYSSLFDYCVRGLRYSEPAAQRRISAMRLLREIPEIEEKVQNGSLTLSHLSQAQAHFKQEARSNHALKRKEKLKVIQAIEGTTSREAEKTLFTLSSNPQPLPTERVRAVSESHTELRLVLKDETMADLEILKGLLAHRFPDMSLSELVELIAKLALERLDPARAETQSSESKTPLPAPKVSRHIPRSIRRKVYLRDGSRCTYQDPESGRKCGSRYKLEIDHIIPYAIGGTNALENLRLLCRNHNQRRAILQFGLRQFDSKRPSTPDPYPNETDDNTRH